jgi:hypothetical protein
MNTDALRGFLQLGFFIGGCGLLMSFVQPRQSAEFVLSVCSAIMGFGVLAVALFLARRMGLQPDPAASETAPGQEGEA